MQKQLKISLPTCCKDEVTYTLKVVFDEFLGFNYQLNEKNSEQIVISYHGSSAKLILNIDFFNKCQNHWLQDESMPSLPLVKWNLSKEALDNKRLNKDIPVIYGYPGLKKNGNDWYLNCDIFGSIFFMLSRYEETICKDRDHHSRFPATASIAFKENFLVRPIVDEYVEILFACMKQLWPELKRKEQEFKKYISCDLDFPYLPYVQSFVRTVIKSIGNLIKHRSISSAIIPFKRYLLFNFGYQHTDPYRKAITFIMDVNEQAGNKVAFYFITYKTSKFDCVFEYDTKYMRNLLREIHERGHEIGLHPGYETFNKPENFAASVKILKRILKEEGIEQEILGGRQHVLRWDAAQTPQLWEKHGFDYDSTLGFADSSGYRCGTSREYTMYDLINRKAMNLKQRPLQVMECTVMAERYEALGHSNESRERFLFYKKQSQAYQTPYSLLWHNVHLIDDVDKKLYKELIQ